MNSNKHTLRRRIQDAKASPVEREQLLQLVDQAGDDEESLAALERRLTAALGGAVKAYQAKIPRNIHTK